jgi:hypothetical protein
MLLTRCAAANFRRPADGVVLREAVMRPHHNPGQSGTIEKKRNSGARVPKVEITRQYKLALVPQAGARQSGASAQLW